VLVNLEPITQQRDPFLAALALGTNDTARRARMLILDCISLAIGRKAHCFRGV
jgi:hypothetical protein